MPALFPRWATPAGRWILTGGVVLGLGAPLAAMAWVRTPWARGEHVRVVQPVPFDHGLHVAALHINCLYCHANADRSAWAGLPATQQCVACHTPTWMVTRPFTAVRRSLATGRPIPWRRVTQLPGFVYFNHAIHVHKGVGCETCHGRVDLMPDVRQTAPLTMSWCVDCHRDPAPALRPRNAVTMTGWTPPKPGDALRRALAARYHVRRLTNCTTCHR